MLLAPHQKAAVFGEFVQPGAGEAEGADSGKHRFQLVVGLFGRLDPPIGSVAFRDIANELDGRYDRSVASPHRARHNPEVTHIAPDEGNGESLVRLTEIERRLGRAPGTRLRGLEVSIEFHPARAAHVAVGARDFVLVPVQV